MKRYLSVLMLVARSSIYKLMGVIALTAVIQTVIFMVALNTGSGFTSLEALFGNYFKWAFIVSLSVSIFLLCQTGGEKGSGTKYTVWRLSVSEKSLFFIQAAFNFICISVIILLQAILIFTLATYFVKNAEVGSASAQTVFLAFYRNSFLHSVLPFEDISLWVRNVFLAAAIALFSAKLPFCRRRGKNSMNIHVISVITVLFFERALGSLEGNIFVCVIMAISIAESVLYVFKNGEVRESDEEKV